MPNASPTLAATNFIGEAAMLEILFTIGQAISAAAVMYGACLAIDYAVFPESRERNAAADEAPEIGRFLGV